MDEVIVSPYFLNTNTNMKYLFTLALLLGTTLVSFAQNKIGTVKGVISDTAGNRNLASATINILDGKDSSLVTFSRSRENGSFEIPKLDGGNYVLLVSYTGFNKIQRSFSISADKPVHDFGSIAMTSVNSLADVTVTASPVQIKGDTIEYNAGSFKVLKPNAVVEDLLKKLPGVEVDKNGTITANGQEVKRVLVDGKPFFSNDPKLATKNLQADMVNKVQVFEKKSDKSEFTGFDDGNSEPTINLTLKADKRVGVFGKLSAGYGTEKRYQANANLNSFKKGEQISFIGQANNINQQGFSLMDALSFSGGMGGASGGNIGRAVNMMSGGSGLNVAGPGGAGSTQGITGTQSAGLNYNNFKNSKLDFTSSYFFNGTHNLYDYNTRRETFLGDTSQVYYEPGKQKKDNYNHRLNLGLDWKIDSNNSIKITPTFTYQNTENRNSRTYQTFGEKGNMLLDGMSNTTSENSGYNFSTTALWRHKFAKKGRTFSVEGKVGRNQSDGTGTQYTRNSNLVGLSRKDTLDQRSTSDAVANSYSVNASYTEPLSRRSLIEINGYYNHSDNNNDRRTYNYNKNTAAYDLLDPRYSNLFDNDYNYAGAGLNYRENRTGWNYAFGATAQHAELTSLVKGKTDPVNQSFWNILPNAQLQISKNRYRNFRANYNGATSQPSVTQLQPVEDISDPLNITRGNPALKQSFRNNLRLSYNSFDPYTMKSFFVMASASNTVNAIVNVDSFFRNGGKLTTYKNANGVYSLSGNGNIGLPLKIFRTKANLSLTSGASYNQGMGYLTDSAKALRSNRITNLTLRQNVSVNYTYKELFDISLGGGINWSRARYTLQPTQNTNYFTYTTSFDFTVYLPAGFVLNSDLDYYANTGRAAGYNTHFTLWNASVSRSFLKNKKGDLKFSVYDILNQNTGVTRNTGTNSIEDISYNVLKQYFMLTFTYSLSKFGNIGGGAGAPRMMMMGAPR